MTPNQIHEGGCHIVGATHVTVAKPSLNRGRGPHHHPTFINHQLAWFSFLEMPRRMRISTDILQTAGKAVKGQPSGEFSQGTVWMTHVLWQLSEHTPKHNTSTCICSDPHLTSPTTWAPNSRRSDFLLLSIVAQWRDIKVSYSCYFSVLRQLRKVNPKSRNNTPIYQNSFIWSEMCETKRLRPKEREKGDRKR